MIDPPSDDRPPPPAPEEPAEGIDTARIDRVEASEQEAETIAHADDATLVQGAKADPLAGLAMTPVAPGPAETFEPRPGRVADLGGLRVVIVAWCIWLLGAWAVSWISDTSVPRVRWMLFAGTFGLMLVWPAFRLSQHVRPGDPVRGALQVLLDWLSLVLVYQAVVWSLNLIAAWPIARGAWLDAAVVAWSLLSALIVAVARLWPGAAARWVGMLLCIALVFAEPVAIWISLRNGGEGWAMRVSPIQATWELTRSTQNWTVDPWDKQTMLIGLVAVTGWLSLGGWMLGERLVARRRARQRGMQQG